MGLSRTKRVLSSLLLGSLPAAVFAGTPFVMNGHAFADQQAFIDSGARCSTHQPSSFEVQLLALQERSFIAEQAMMGRDVTATGGTIPVYWHSITNSAGQGAPTSGQIQAQISVKLKPEPA